MPAAADQIKMVVFDMAGTTVHDEDFVTLSFQKALLDGGIDVSRDEVNEVMGYPKPEAIRRILATREGSEPAPAQVNALHDTFLETMNTFYETDERVREIEGATETFRFLKASGRTVALNTGFSRPTASIIIRKFGWDDPGLVDFTITSDEVEKGRPHSDMIEELMRRAGIENSFAVAKVGDTASDLLEGQAAGCGWNIGVTEGSWTRQELEPHPHTHLIGSVADLPELF